MVPASHTLSVLSREPDTIVLPSGEKATDITQWLCALCFSPLSSRDAVASVGDAQLWVRQGIGRDGVPASQTLMVLSLEPDTMVLPSGEKATEYTQSLCAFSALSSREATTNTGAVHLGREGSGVSVRTHPHPTL